MDTQHVSTPRKGEACGTTHIDPGRKFVLYHMFIDWCCARHVCWHETRGKASQRTPHPCQCVRTTRLQAEGKGQWVGCALCFSLLAADAPGAKQDPWPSRFLRRFPKMIPVDPLAGWCSRFSWKCKCARPHSPKEGSACFACGTACLAGLRTSPLGGHPQVLLRLPDLLQLVPHLPDVVPHLVKHPRDCRHHSPHVILGRPARWPVREGLWGGWI
mmetsp:Transcript_26683/g.74953  ORF Transcript_26683/g.74953 Transcript_26683/m.74953 type:complete len:215 (-) Transcript_26683:2597-3241(-)